MHLRRIVVTVALGTTLGCRSDSTSATPGDTYALQVITAAPANAALGSTVSVAVTVTKEENGSSTPAAGQTVSFTVLLGGGSIGGALTATQVSAADGSAGVSWQIGPTTGVQTLRASISASVYVDFTTTATALPATQLGFAVQPSLTTAAGIAFSRQPVVQLLNVNGVTVAQSGVVVTAQIASGTGALTGTATATTNAGGAATFTNLGISAAGLTTLRFSATLGGQTASVVSNITNVVTPNLNQLVLSTSPSGVTVGAASLFEQPVVQLEDATGNPLHQAGVQVTVAAASGTAVLGVASGGTGSLVVATDANGQAAFHDLALTGTGTSQLEFAAQGFNLALSDAIDVVAGGNLGSLPNGPPVGPLTADSATVTYLAFSVPTGATSMTFTTFSGTGSVQLFVRGGTFPTSSDFSCESALTGPSQTCTVTSGLVGTWYIALFGATAYANTAIQVEAPNAACAERLLTINVTVNSTLTPGLSCTVDAYGVLADRYSLAVPAAQAVTLVTTGSISSTFLVIKRAQDIGFSLGTGIAVPPVLLLSAGTYDVLVEDNTSGGTTTPLPYTLTVTPVTPPAVVGCAPFAAPSTGLTIGLTLTATDCAGTTAGTLSHRIAVALATGQTITVTMTSTAFHPVARVLAGLTVTGAATVLAADNNSGGGTTAQVTFTNTSDAALFTLEMTSTTTGANGAYVMTESVSPPGFLQARLVPLQTGASVTIRHPQ